MASPRTPVITVAACLPLATKMVKLWSQIHTALKTYQRHLHIEEMPWRKSGEVRGK